MIDGVIEVTPSSLQDMATETRRLRRLAEDFSSLSKAQERRFDLILEPRDLADIVTAAATRMGPQLEDEGIDLALSVPPLPVTADEDRIMQVVTNLLGNAVAATGRGGHIRIAGRQEAGWAVVDVADTGVGLAPDDVERVFERFYRAHQGRASGSGIGLTISRELMRAHGGELSAHSDGPGQGATFSVWLPIRRTEPSRARGPGPVPRGRCCQAPGSARGRRCPPPPGRPPPGALPPVWRPGLTTRRTTRRVRRTRTRRRRGHRSGPRGPGCRADARRRRRGAARSSRWSRRRWLPDTSRRRACTGRAPAVPPRA